MADEPQTHEQTASTGGGGNGNGLAGALSEMMKPLNALLKNLSHRMEVVERTVMEDHRPRIVKIESGVSELQRGHAGIQGHLAEQDTRTTQQTDTILTRLNELETGRVQNQQGLAEALRQMTLMNGNVTLLNTTFKGSVDHRRETNKKVVETVEGLQAQVRALEQAEATRVRVETEHQARLAEIATRQEAARKAAVAAVAVQVQARREQLGMAWRFMALILPVLLNYGVNATTLPHPVKNAVAVLMLLIVAAAIIFTAWTWLRPPRTPPLIDPLTGRPFPPPDDTA